MQIRKYNKSDLHDILQLFFETVRFINSKDYSPFQIDTWAPLLPNCKLWEERLEKNFCYVAEIHGKIVGFGDLTNEGLIFNLYTHKDYQNQGIASKILEKLEKEAKKRKYKEVKTEASITAKPFFEKRGYLCIKEQNKLFHGVNFINFLMRKTLE